jgi:DNA-binding IclR family transcriptional regulator
MLSSLMNRANGPGSPDETPAAPDNSQANAIEKALSILVVLIRQDRPLGTVQISRLTGFHKATTSRILGTLERFGLVVQSAQSRKYLVGPLGYELGMTQMNAALRSLAALAQPYLSRLAAQFETTALLEIWVGRQAVIVACATARPHGRALPRLGEARPLPQCAGGRAILAALQDDLVRKLVAPPVQPVTQEMLASAEALARDLTHIRQTGLAEGKSGALATSLVDDQANPIGAVTLCPGEAQGTMRDGLAQALIATARRLAVAIDEANMSSLDDWRYDED